MFITTVCITIYIAIYICSRRYHCIKSFIRIVMYIVTCIFSITQELGKFLLKVLVLQGDLGEG